MNSPQKASITIEKMKTFFTIIIVLSAINLYGQTIVIENDSIITWDNRYVKEMHNQFGFFSFIQVDVMLNDFAAFKTALGEHNVDFMNRSSGLFTFGFGGTYKKWLADLNFGFSRDSDFKNDTLTVKLNSTKYGLTFGYNLLNNKRFIVTPKTSINWNRYRLVNSSKEKISLEGYIHNRDLDIRFNQLTGFVGLNISHKFYNYMVLPSDYWTVGLYGGYIFQFNQKPWVYSLEKRLLNDNKINLKNYSVGIRITWNIE